MLHPINPFESVRSGVHGATVYADDPATAASCNAGFIEMLGTSVSQSVLPCGCIVLAAEGHKPITFQSSANHARKAN